MGYRLDGNVSNFLEVPSTRIFNPTVDPRPMAISMWLRPAALGTALQAVYYNDNNGNSPAIVCLLDNSNFRFFSAGAADVTTTMNSIVTVDTWNHFGVLWVDTAVMLFINGALRRTATSTAFVPNTATSSSRIGRYAGALGAYTGDSAEYAFWSGTVPSASEMAALWTGSEAGLLADSFDEQPFRYNRFNGALTDEKGGTAFSVFGTVNASVAIASSPPHPTISGGGATTPFRAYGRYGVRGPVR